MFKQRIWFNTLSISAFGFSIFMIISFIILLLSSCLLTTGIFIGLGSKENSRFEPIDIDSENIFQNNNTTNQVNNKGRNAYDVNELADLLKSNYKLPEKITDDLFLKDICDVKSIRFVFDDTSVLDRPDNDKELFNLLKKIACNNEFLLFKNILSKDFSIDYEYNVRSTNKVYIYTINKNHCPK